MLKGGETVSMHEHTAFCKNTKNASASALIALDIGSYFNGQLL